MNDHATSNYRQAAARGATPLGQVIVLYDTILRDFFRALAALKAGNVTARIAEMNHAVSVIGYLFSVLDHQRGGAAAAQLSQVYTTSMDMIVKANARGSIEAIEELIEIYGDLRQAWYQADQNLNSGGKAAAKAPYAPPSASAARHRRAATPAPDSNPRRHWSS
jgi:flagellar secretion chaperone FliS